MKIFLSWSKEPAKTIANDLRDILQMVVPGAEVWMSERDIGKGERWSAAIAGQLDATDTGIVIVTRQNRLEPWLFFEAGALSKSVAAGRVHPLVVGAGHSVLEGPLQQFQATKFERDDVLELFRALNGMVEKPKADPQLVRDFDRVWPGFEKDVLTAVREADGLIPEGVGTPAKDASGSASADDMTLTQEEADLIKIIVNHAGKRGIPASWVAQTANIHPERAKLRLQSLEKREFIYASHVIGQGAFYSLEDKGREYALEQGWI